MDQATLNAISGVSASKRAVILISPFAACSSGYRRFTNGKLQPAIAAKMMNAMTSDAKVITHDFGRGAKSAVEIRITPRKNGICMDVIQFMHENDEYVFCADRNTVIYRHKPTGEIITVDRDCISIRPAHKTYIQVNIGDDNWVTYDGSESYISSSLNSEWRAKNGYWCEKMEHFDFADIRYGYYIGDRHELPRHKLPYWGVVIDRRNWNRKGSEATLGSSDATLGSSETDFMAVVPAASGDRATPVSI